MIDVTGVLRALPRFEAFCSVSKLHSLVEELRHDSQNFRIETAGTSVNGLPIHHIAAGKGSIKALIVAFPHCSEPVGGLTVFSLLTLLRQGNRELLDADVEWHIVPCIDPDGAILNEGWTQKPFTLGNHMRNFYKQEVRDQVEMSFPLKYKHMLFDHPTKEAGVLQKLLTDIRPDFYFSLHNAVAGGAFFLLNRDIEHRYHQQLYKLLEQHGISLQRTPSFGDWCTQFGVGIKENFTTKKFYDFLAKTIARPENSFNFGATSWEFLADLKEDALSFVAELPYTKHPSDGSTKELAQSLRQLKLRIDADNKFIVTVILEEWEKVKDELDEASPFYRKIFNGMVTVKDKLPEGLPWWPTNLQDLLFNPAYAGAITEGERLNEHELRYYLLCNCYEFVRLLKESPNTAATSEAIKRLDSVFDQALAEIEIGIGLDHLETIDCDTLAEVQLGSGLIVLNSVLDARKRLLGCAAN